MVITRNLLFIFVILTGCAEHNSSANEVIEVNPIERQKMYLAQERAQIEAYIVSHELDGIQRNGFGMFELGIIEGEGKTAKFGDHIIYSATVYLLNDSGIGQYTDTVELGRSEMETGLHESLKGMQEGEMKLVLIPSFLAHGIAGDLDRIPPQSPMRYDIRLIQVVR
jgi:FKBP-type peptidyl-prolyl cis-trans isomerase FkpA